MDVEGELQLPRLVRSDAYTVLYGAVVFQCCVKEGGGEGDRRGGEGGEEILETMKEVSSRAEIQSQINSY